MERPAAQRRRSVRRSTTAPHSCLNEDDAPVPVKRARSAATASGAKRRKALAAGSRGGPTRAAESALWARGFGSVAGVDEAGRGPLAGPVVAAAVVLPRDAAFPGLDDSKVLTEEQRDELYAALTADPGVSWAV